MVPCALAPCGPSPEGSLLPWGPSLEGSLLPMGPFSHVSLPRGVPPAAHESLLP